MSQRSGPQRRHGSTSSFNAFRVSKAVPKSNVKNVKAAPLIRNDSKDQDSAAIVVDVPISRKEPDELLDSKLEQPLKPVQEEPKVVLPQLDESDDEYLRAAATIRGVKQTPILHTNPNTIETILRDFDLTGKYGPCVGISRLDRFNRAVRMNKNPPPEVGKILATQQADEKVEYKHDVSGTLFSCWND